MNDITQALQDAGNARNYKATVNPVNQFYSTWLVDTTKVFTDSVDNLLAYVSELGIEAVEKTNHRTLKNYYDLQKDGAYAGLIDQPEYEEEIALTSNGWLAIIHKEYVIQ